MKKRILLWIIPLAVLVVAAAIVVGILLLSNRMPTVDNEYLYSLEGTWDGARDFSENRAAVKKDGKWGYIDINGNVIVEPQYDAAYSFSEGLAAVQNGGKWGYVDRKGQLVIPFTLDSAAAFSNGLAVFSEGYYYGYINPKGEKVIPAAYDEASSFKDGVACVKKGNRYGFIDKTGTAITQFIYGGNASPSEGLIPVFYGDSTKGINTGYIDFTGRQILPFSWYDAKPFSEGLAAACKEYTTPYGYIDNTGAYVIEPAWDGAEDFSCGCAVVEKDRLYTYINKNGERITEKTYQKAYAFTMSEVARVGIPNGSEWSFGYIDTTGKEIIAPQYPDARDFQIGFAAVSNGKKWGFINREGTAISGMKWTDVGDFTEDGIALVKSGDTYGFIKLK